MSAPSPSPPQDEDDEAELLSSRERPEGLDDAAWVRLLEFRQTRAELELVRQAAGGDRQCVFLGGGGRGVARMFGKAAQDALKTADGVVTTGGGGLCARAQ